jgi:hypothetical protein
MQVRHIALAVLAAAVTLTSVAAAGLDAAKQRVAINAKILPAGTFVLTPLRAGALKRDSGTVNGNWPNAPGRTVVRNGQKVETYTNTWTLTGTQGTLTYYLYDDPTCMPHTVTAPRGFVDDARAHMVRNESGQPAQDVSVIIAPAGGAFRGELDAPNPNCGF